VLRRKRWFLRRPLSPDKSGDLGCIPPTVAQILRSRGVTTAEQAERFLRMEPPVNSDPMMLTGMQAAANRILSSLRAGEKVAIYGDYDTDGVTATALLVRYLRGWGAAAFAYIPSRFEEGYGLHAEALRKLKQEGYALVITVDCGIRSLEESNVAGELGLDLVITDHHEPLPQLPAALAVIDPKIPANIYPDRDLAGVGIAYKLVQALERQLGPSRGRSDRFLEECLELVAVGTVADVAPLLGENRSLVGAGLARLNTPGGPRNPGLRALMQAASLKPGKVTGGTIGFVLGPRLNSAGRVEHALTAYSLLETDSPDVALDLATQLSDWNRERQQVTHEVTARAREQILAFAARGGEGELPFFLFASDPSYHPGVIGLAASRLCEEFYRPVAVVAVDSENGQARGSARSIPEFHLVQALDQCKELLLRHGGHAAAAGFSVSLADLPRLQGRLQSLAQAELSQQALEPHLDVDVVVHLAELPELASWVKSMEPCGQGNPQPVFVTPQVRVVSKRAVGAKGNHLMLRVAEGKAAMDAIAFGRGPEVARLPEEVSVAYQLEEDDYYGTNRLRLNILDLGEIGLGGSVDPGQ
jgi:single-stranded-DNA-specific exonuclease